MIVINVNRIEANNPPNEKYLNIGFLSILQICWFVLNSDSANHFYVVDKDTKKGDELINGIISRVAHLNNLKTTLKTASELITLINREYHLK